MCVCAPHSILEDLEFSASLTPKLFRRLRRVVNNRNKSHLNISSIKLFCEYFI